MLLIAAAFGHGLGPALQLGMVAKQTRKEQLVTGPPEVQHGGVLVGLDDLDAHVSIRCNPNAKRPST